MIGINPSINGRSDWGEMDSYMCADLARQLDKPRAALSRGTALVENLDGLAAALSLQSNPAYSPLRTLLTQGLEDLRRVQAQLRDHDAVPPTSSP
jgi:hypothetical protein